MYKHILVPTDGSPLSLKAVKEAAALAKALKGRISALYVIAPFSPPMSGDGYLPRVGELQAAYKKATEEAASKALKKAEATARAAKVACTTAHVVNDQPWAGIIKAAKDSKCDVIVMASHGRRGIAGFLLGSETTKVLTHSKTPVLVCR